MSEPVIHECIAGDGEVLFPAISEAIRTDGSIESLLRQVMGVAVRNLLHQDDQSTVAWMLAEELGELVPTIPVSCVYFIQDATNRRIKIGWSGNVRRRLSELRGPSSGELRVLGVVPGGPKLEAIFHRRFSEQRIHNEWFSPKIAKEVFGIAKEMTVTHPAGQITKRDIAKAWLLDLLAEGPIGSKDLRAMAAQEGHQWASVRRARGDLGDLIAIRNNNSGRGNRGSIWELAPDRHGADLEVKA